MSFFTISLKECTKTWQKLNRDEKYHNHYEGNLNY